MATLPPTNLSASWLAWICGWPDATSIQRQLLNWLLFFSGIISLLVALLFVLLGLGAAGPTIGGIVCLATYGMARLQRLPPLLIQLMPFVIYFPATTYGWLRQGGLAGSMPFYAIMPFLIAIAVLEEPARQFMLLATVAQLAFLTYLQVYHPTWVNVYPTAQIQQIDLFFSAALIALFCIGYMGVLIYNLEQHRRQIDAMLYNILPASVADTLQQHPDRNIAHYFENVSILFADIVNFTPLSAGLTPVALVSLLNGLFSDFDALVTKYGVEKVKTIGDCYMIAAGAPSACTHHAQQLVRLALEMQELVKTKQYQGHTLTVRIGINSGSVVAGVIGTNKFTYDLWGDAVNTASRMESHSSAGIIQITNATYELIHDQFICEPHGEIDVKGKGAMAVWYVLGERPAPVL